MNGLRDKPSSHRFLSYADTVAAQWRDGLLLVARILAGLLYMQSGWEKLGHIPSFAATLARHGVPLLLGYLAPLVEFFGGVALILGFATRYTALLMILFTAAAAWTSHRYWTVPEAARGRQFTQFWKNVTMIGGFLALFVTGGGRFSLDGLLRKIRR